MERRSHGDEEIRRLGTRKLENEVTRRRRDKETRTLKGKIVWRREIEKTK